MRIAALMVAVLFLSGQPVVNESTMIEPFRRPVDTTQVLTRIAFGSCNHQQDPQTIWKTVMSTNPDLWIWMGDNIYANTQNAHVMFKGYDLQLRHPEYQQLLAFCPVIGTWDDHDYGFDQADRTNPIREFSQQFFLEFMAAPADDPRRHREGIYTSYSFGEPGRTVKIILLDTRYFRELPGEDAQLLGKAQWAWLEEQVADTMPDLVLIASGMQVLSAKPERDCWGLYPKEKRSLLSLLQEVPAGPCRDFFISGDVHFTEALGDTLESGVVLHEFTSSGLTHTDKLTPTSYDSLSVTGPVSEKNFGLLTIDWEAKTLLFESHGENREVLVSHKVRFGGATAVMLP